MSKKKRLVFIMSLTGLAAVTALLAWQGFGAVLTLFASIGYGLFAAPLLHFLSMTLNARGWQVLLPRNQRPTTLFFVWAVWLRESVNGLLPVARIGGEVVTARLLIDNGLSTAWSVASLVADVTVSLASQYLFTMIGLGLLLLGGDRNQFADHVALGLLIVIPIGIAVVVVQRYGLFQILARLVGALFGERFQSLIGDINRLDEKLRQIYRRRRDVLACGVWQLLGWLASSCENYVVLIFMQHPISIANALIIEALLQALTSGAFVVPGALGIQEGGFVFIGGLVGLPADVALALALARRARDVLLFLPAVIFAQYKAGHALARGARKP